MKDTSIHYDVIVIGGGASGMMAAGRAAERGRRVLLLEKNSALGEKLKITGGGRCNITNAQESIHTLLANYGAAAAFLHSSFAQFGVAETFSFFTDRGLPLVVQAQQRAFPQTEKALDVVRVLEKYLQKNKVTVLTNTPVRELITQDGKVTGVRTGKQVYAAETYIVATGGVSHPQTGSTGDGFAWLEKLGHTVHPPTPTIVPLAVRDEWVKGLAGKTLPNAKSTFYVDGKKQFTVTGNILCTHFGLSGPTILNVAGKVADALHQGAVSAIIDLFPKTDLGALDAQLLALFDTNKNKTLKNIFPQLVPAGTTRVLLSLAPGLDPEIKVHSIVKQQRKQLAHLLKALPVAITGLMGYDRAVIADGGVSLKEVDAKTMRSQKYVNLFVTGDVLHITRPSGGYSLQLCWTTGAVAGSHA